jgi:VCBS repeat-containing protein
LNFVDKFDAGLPLSGAGLHPKALLHVDSISTHAPSNSIVIEDAHLLFNGDYRRTGLDLVIAKDGRELTVPDYFRGEKRASLASPDGAHLTGDIVSALAGHTQYAQADGSASAATVIGHVTKLTGNATVIRNGVSIVLNLGDNVNKGDVVQSGSSSTLGITFIDGSVFGLGSNAKMVLNEMVYDPNGSSNSSLLSLVQGTISFVAGATAKHGDMKVDTPVATMGIRGTAVLVEIDFEVPGTGGAPPARFQVLVEPDGTTGSYVLLDKITLSPIATVNQAGTQTTVSGQGVVSFNSSVQLSQEAQDVINKVFALKFTDNSNPQSNTKFTDVGVPQNTFIQLANGQFVPVTFLTVSNGSSTPPPAPPTGKAPDRIPGPPTVNTFAGAFAERTAFKASPLIDSVSGGVSYFSINAGDVPTVKTAFNSYIYRDAQGQNVSAGLTAEQLAAILPVTVPLVVAQDPAAKNTGTAIWTYNIADHALDFLAEGEKLELTYIAEVANNYHLNNEKTFTPFTITITGTNDTPIIATTHGTFAELPGTANSAIDHAGGTITFQDVDLTDRPTVTTAFTSYTYQNRSGNDVTATLTNEQKAGIAAVDVALTLTPAPGNGHNGSVNWSYDVADVKFDFLAAGEVLTLTYTATVNDGHGGVASVPVTVKVTGTNDVPTIATTTSGITERIGTGNTALNVAQGTVTFTDVDLTDRPVVTTTFGSFQYLDENGNDITVFLTPQQLAAIGEVDIDLIVTQTSGNRNNGTATWVYSLVDSKFDFLADGETLILTYVAQVDDGHGGIISTPITVSVNGADVSVGGTNDVPVVATTNNAFTELSGQTGSTANDQVTGSVTFTDPDLTDTHSVKILSVAATGVTSGLAGNAIVKNWLSLGTLTDSTNGATGSRPWTFKALDSNFDYLAKDEVLTLTYTIEVDDGHGGVVEKPVKVTITGTNDAPMVNAIAATPLDEQTDTDPLTTTIVVTFTDVALNDVGHTASVTAVVKSGKTAGLAGLTDAQLKALVTPETVTKAAGSSSGSVNLDFSAASTVFDYLATGETVTLTYTVAIDDGDGGTTPQTFAVTVTGSNDAPTITSGVQAVSFDEQPDMTGSTAEDVQTGTVTFTDADYTDVHSVTISGISASGTVSGQVTATMQDWLSLEAISDSNAGAPGSVMWRFAADDYYFDYLADGEHVAVTYTLLVDDGYGGIDSQQVEVTIKGSNDAPQINLTTVSSVSEDASTGIIPSLYFAINDKIIDPDGDPLTYSFSNPSVADVFSTGQDSVTVTPGAAFQYLNTGETALASIDVTATDTHGVQTTRTISWTVTGVNDAPVITSGNGATASVSIVENGTAVTTVTATDIDSAILTYSIVDDYATSPDANNFTIDSNTGALSFVTAPDYETPGSAAGSNDYTVKVQVSDGAGGVDIQTLTVTVSDSGGPEIDTEHFTTDSDGDNAPTTVTGLSVSNANAAEALTLTMTTAQSGQGSTIAPPSGSGNLAAINDAIESVVYNPGSTPPLNDKVMFTVAGASGTDTVNFIFIQADTGSNLTLQGTSGKDVIFGTESSDTLTGGAGADQFVFGPTSSGTVQHTITDFETPLDKIDLREFSAIDGLEDITVVQQGNDTVITLDSVNHTIRLQNVIADNMHSNFIFHA